ncbi:MAG: TIGR01212 family radical SAM protein [Candidatus Gastranaerophilales bacterium]|nr:TIGR01212 family radical SAM protein [Candidatus Gastranaerophilales bacterium]
MLFYNSDKRYNQFSSHLKNLFGEKVYKVTLDAGFTCPNRDGYISKDGCIFCDGSGSFSQLYSNNLSVKEQLEIGVSTIKDRFSAKKFLVYFQAYSNTYAEVSVLKKIYDEALSHEDVVGISIGTRPDCVDEKKLELIGSYTKNYYTWLEYGLQSIHDKTLKYINRGHDFKCFEKACQITKKHNINICAHVILGLPNESKKDMLETAKVLGDMGIDGVKIHMLCVLKNTKLAELYQNGQIHLMSEDEYVETVCDFLELLPPNVVLERFAGNGLKSERVQPSWLEKKWVLINKLDAEFKRRNSYQGAMLINV